MNATATRNESTATVTFTIPRTMPHAMDIYGMAFRAAVESGGGIGGYTDHDVMVLRATGGDRIVLLPWFGETVAVGK
jgi:hypothetical protein